MKMLYPPPLTKGDKIAIISPATIVDESYIDGASRLLAEKGFVPVVSEYAKGKASGSYASSEENRLSDLLTSLHDSSIKAILCARGGYGCIHLLPYIKEEDILRNPKWIIGFSDVSALHALWQRAGVASIHGPMAKHLSTEVDEDECTRLLIGLLTGREKMDYKVSSHPFNIEGEAVGRLVGGNLAVLNGLAGTGYDLLAKQFDEGTILFIEDISEAIYAVERMLIRLYLSGVIDNVKGLVIGQFTEYRPDRNHPDMETMIHSLLNKIKFSGKPVAFSFPVGHVAHNLPLIEGGLVKLQVWSDSVTIKQIDK